MQWFIYIFHLNTQRFWIQVKCTSVVASLCCKSSFLCERSGSILLARRYVKSPKTLTDRAEWVSICTHRNSDILCHIAAFWHPRDGKNQTLDHTRNNRTTRDSDKSKSVMMKLNVQELHPRGGTVKTISQYTTEDQKPHAGNKLTITELHNQQRNWPVIHMVRFQHGTGEGHLQLIKHYQVHVTRITKLHFRNKYKQRPLRRSDARVDLWPASAGCFRADIYKILKSYKTHFIISQNVL